MQHLGKDFGSFTALAEMGLTIGTSEFVALLGPLGCGKSTMTNMIAGLLEPSQGEIRFDGRRMNGVPMAKRVVGFVFQNYAIFTHMTVRENLAYGLKARGVARSETSRRVAEIAEFPQLGPMLDRRAAGLSLNIPQRLAIGRPAVVEPAIFLLDEPLSNVDAAFRAVMDHGRLLQVGTPLEVYDHPLDTFVARFIGSPGMNLLRSTVTGGDAGLTVDLGAARRCPALAATGGEVLFGFRREQVHPDAAGPLAMTVTTAERIGARTILHLAAGEHTAGALLDSATPVPGQGEPFRFAVTPEDVRLSDAATGRALRWLRFRSAT